MKFKNPPAYVYIPDGAPEPEALARTTHLAISAHQDDIEIMAVDGVLRCFQKQDAWFSGVVVTNGSGSPRTGLYGQYTDDEMMQIRQVEQKKAAFVGDYAAQFMLNYSSSQVKNAANPDVAADLESILLATRPQVVYTHNLADKHDTHVSTALRVIAALRRLPAEARPHKVYGCEVWRSLDWLLDEDKVAFDVSDLEGLQYALLGVFDSQITGGKRYDLATLGRRRANATYHASHGTDVATGLTFAMDLTPLVTDPNLEPAAYVQQYMDRFMQDVCGRLKSFS